MLRIPVSAPAVSIPETERRKGNEASAGCRCGSGFQTFGPPSHQPQRYRGHRRRTSAKTNPIALNRKEHQGVLIARVNVDRSVRRQIQIRFVELQVRKNRGGWCTRGSRPRDGRKTHKLSRHRRAVTPPRSFRPPPPTRWATPTAHPSALRHYGRGPRNTQPRSSSSTIVRSLIIPRTSPQT